MKFTLKGRHRLTKDGVLISEHVRAEEAYERAHATGPGTYLFQPAPIEVVVQGAVAAPAPAPAPAPATIPVVHATPRVAALDYSQVMTAERAALLARFRRVIVGLGKDKGHARIIEFVRAIYAANPDAMVGQYVCCTEWATTLASTDAKRQALDEINANGWFLRTAAGTLTQQMKQTSLFDVNPTLATLPNAQGERWPEFKARFDDGVLPPGLFRFIFQDNCNAWPRVAADWNRDGVDEQPAEAAAAMRAGYRAYADALRLRHGLPICGNVETKDPTGPQDPTLACPEWKGALAMAYLEKMVGVPEESPEAWGGFAELASRITGTIAALPGGDVILGLRANSTDEAVYGLCISMLWDCWASIHMHDTPTKVYTATPLWLPEFDAPIGSPLEPAVFDGSVAQRRFTNGRVLVNHSKTTAAAVPTPEFGTVSMPPRSGRILTPTQ